MNRLFNAMVEDSLTLLRANAIVARWINEHGIPVYTSGEAIDEVLDAGYSLGLSFPLNHVAYMFLIPDPAAVADLQVHIRVIYAMNYTFRFDSDIFDADVIVDGAETAFVDQTIEDFERLERYRVKR